MSEQDRRTFLDALPSPSWGPISPQGQHLSLQTNAVFVIGGAFGGFGTRAGLAGVVPVTYSSPWGDEHLCRIFL